jgi:hypothetical protein
MFKGATLNRQLSLWAVFVNFMLVTDAVGVDTSGSMLSLLDLVNLKSLYTLIYKTFAKCGLTMTNRLVYRKWCKWNVYFGQDTSSYFCLHLNYVWLTRIHLFHVILMQFFWMTKSVYQCNILASYTQLDVKDIEIVTYMIEGEATVLLDILYCVCGWKWKDRQYLLLNVLLLVKI